MIISRPMARQVNAVQRRLIPIETVERLRHDPAWSGAVRHLEQGVLGLGINYKKEIAKKDHFLDQQIVSELMRLRGQVRELRERVRDEESGLETQVKSLGAKLRESKSAPKKACKDPTRTTIQVSMKFKQFLKEVKGKKSYEEFIVEKMEL